MADQGELQEGSNLGKGQVKAADYFLQPDIVTTNSNSGGGGVAGALGGLLGGRMLGGLAGGLNIKKKEANVTLAVVNARTTVEEALVEGHARKSDVSFGGGAGGGWWGGFAAAGGAGYQNTEIGQVIVLAYLDAYTKLVTQLGGLPCQRVRGGAASELKEPGGTRASARDGSMTTAAHQGGISRAAGRPAYRDWPRRAWAHRACGYAHHVIGARWRAKGRPSSDPARAGSRGRR